MKKITYLLALLLFICCQEEERWNSSKDIRVIASCANTRTLYTEEGNVTHVSWEKDDRVRLFTEKQTNLIYAASETGQEAELHQVGDANKLKAADGDSVYAYYSYFDLDEEHFRAPFQIPLPPMEWQHASSSPKKYDFLYAAGEVNGNLTSLQFKHLYAFLKIVFPTEIITSQEMYDPNEKDNEIRVTSTENISMTSGYFDLQKGDTVSTKTRSTIYYMLNNDAILSQKEITCYIAILPQSEEAELHIHYATSSYESCLVNKKAPTGGFKSGNIYTIYLNENEAEMQRRMEREALIEFYNATDGDNWTNNTNWCSDKPINEWYGVSPNRYGLVGWLSLCNNNLNNSKHGESFFSPLLKLTNLEGIQLDRNKLSGSIPAEIGDLANLATLGLSDNNLSGTIPAEIGKLTKLVGLGLENCNLTGKLPKEFTNLSNLMYLNISGNGLEGEFPDLTFIDASNDVLSVYISNNKFTGKLPDFPESETFQLQNFLANNNNFTGNIPKSHFKVLQRHITDWSSPDWACSGENKYRCNYAVFFNNLSGKLPDEIATHENFHVYWFNILAQNQGYGFERVDIPAHTNTVKCYDGSFVNLGEEYKKNEYTILFRWDPYCPYSAPYPQRFESLRQKYQKQGLGIIGMTANRYSNEEIKPFAETMPETKIFWEIFSDEYENNPYGLSKYFYLFRFELTPFFFIIDKQGNIIYYGSGVAYPGTVPQHHEDRDDIFKFVANLFGDDDFVPEAPEYYTSSDYSRDGEVLTLQKATVGKGIDLVFMGEAFTDRDMEPGGKYEQKMKEAMEQYFAFEPYKSFRNRFNVYAVKVVSPNEEFAPDAVRRINEDDGVCIEYAQKVPNIDTNQWRISVIYNTGYSAGRSYTVMYTDRTFVGYMMEGVNNVLNHESGGHGFAKLLDEYIEPGNEYLTLPQDGQEALDYQWKEFGWGANVDWRNDRNTVKWAHLLNDSRYANEGLGLYEGAFLYGFGAYRPTENSMMRYNDTPFNAPSREQIYKCIMQQSEGEGWTYNYEDFVRYDAVNRNNATTRSLKTAPSEKVRDEWKKRHRPPVFVNGTWRDAVKKRQTKNSTIVPLR